MVVFVPASHLMCTFDPLAITQLTYEQAIACYTREDWRGWSIKIRALFQLHQDRSCMPFDVYQLAVEETLGRVVPTHDLYYKKVNLIAEILSSD